MFLVDSISVLRCVKATAAVVMFSALVVVSAKTAALTHDDNAVSRKGKNNNDVGIRGHGFVANKGVFTTIDAPGAGLYTVAFGIDDRGRTVGGYVDDRGRLHGFLKDKEAFTVIDFPGAAATFVSRINTQGQIVGAYSHAPNTALLQAEHGFLLEDGVLRRSMFPAPSRRGCSGSTTRARSSASTSTRRIPITASCWRTGSSRPSMLPPPPETPSPSASITTARSSVGISTTSRDAGSC